MSGPLTFASPTLIDTGQPFSDPDELESLSCTTSTLCVGVASDGGGSQLISSSDPTGGAASDWSVVAAEELPGATEGAAVDGVDCVNQSGQLCVAVGNEANGAGMVLTSTDPALGASGWTQAAAAPPLGAPSNAVTLAPVCAAGASDVVCVTGSDTFGINSSTLYASSDPGGSWSSTPVLVASHQYLGPMTCPSANLCLAGAESGDVYTSPSNPTAAWSRTPSVTGLSGELYGLSCTTTTFCLASGVDSSGNTEIATTTDPAAGASATWVTSTPSGSVGPLIDCYADSRIAAAPHALCIGEDNTPGTVDVSLDGGATWQHEATQEDLTSGFSDVFACLPGGGGVVCIAGGDGDIDFSDNADAVPAASASWSSPVLVTPGLNPVELYPQSCPTSSLCVATDDAGRILTATSGDGAPAWSSSLVDPNGGGIGALSCPSTTLCLAIDGNDQVLRSTNPATGAWAPGIGLEDPNGQLEGLTCVPGTTTCVAYDLEGDTFRTTDGGSTWSGPTTSISDDDPIVGLSCPSTAFCLEINSTGSAMRSTDEGASWTASPYDDPSAHFTSAVSCAPGTELCVAIDSYGEVLTTTDGGVDWSSPSASDVTDLAYGDLACPTATLCVALESNGDVATTTDPAGGGSSWSAPSSSVTAGQANSDALTCAATTQLCLASDSGGDLIATTGWSFAPPPVAPPAPPTQGPTPAPTPAPTPGPPSTSTASPLSATVQSWRAHGHAASAVVSCAGTSGMSCTVTAALEVSETIDHGKVIAVLARAGHKSKPSRRTLVVGSTTAVLAAGQSETVTVALNATGQSLLKSRDALVAALTTSSAGKALATQTVTFTASAEKKKKP